ncbi:MAG TPA: apolipoprotein N-acyltransferase [Actinocrinis sp.]|nr:apolipoprotein N-acyltransferase [Actinocrinis sp.]
MASTKRKSARQWLPALAAAGLGALMSAAFPPEGWWWLAPVTVAGFTWCCRIAAEQREHQRGRRRPAAAGACVGLFFGLTFCVVFFRWITSIGVDVWLGLAVLETLFFIPLGIGTAAVGRLRGAPLWQALLWVAAEAMRDRFPLGGMSWGRLAFSQTDTPFTPLAALGGAPLVSFATALAGTVLAALAALGWRWYGTFRAQQAPLAAEPVEATADDADLPESAAGETPASAPAPKPAARPALPGWRPAAAWVLLAVAVPAVGWLVPLQTTAGKPVELAAIQGNVVQPGINSYGNQDAVLNNHLAVTRQYAALVAAGQAPQPTAVIWPEDSDDVDPYAYPSVYQALTDAAAGINAPILVGAVVGAGPNQVRSEGIVWNPGTGAGASYAKRHLVPFGEYIPDRAFLTKYFSELSRVPDDFVPGTTPGVLTIGGVKIADVICFEVAYDDIVRSSVRGDGGLIVVQTNNADYGWTGQPEQQLAISQLRAVESGRPVLIASTSGISGYITPDGTIVQQTGQFTPAVVAADITPRTGLTLADRVGAAPEWVMTGLAAAAWLLAFARARRRAVRPGADTSGKVAASDGAQDAPVPPPGAVSAGPAVHADDPADGAHVAAEPEARKAPA